MAEIKWSNVDGSALNGAVSNANSAVNSYVRTLFGIGSNVEDFTDKLQKRSDETAEWNRNQNTQQIINQMHDADSADALQQLQSQGIGNAQTALGQFGGQVDLATLNKAKASWVSDVENRATAKDKLRDTTEVAKNRKAEIINLLQQGRQAEAESLIAQSQGVFSNSGLDSLITLAREQRIKDRAYALDVSQTEAQNALSYANARSADATANYTNSKNNLDIFNTSEKINATNTEATAKAREQAEEYNFIISAAPKAVAQVLAFNNVDSATNQKITNSIANSSSLMEVKNKISSLVASETITAEQGTALEQAYIDSDNAQKNLKKLMISEQERQQQAENTRNNFGNIINGGSVLSSVSSSGGSVGSGNTGSVDVNSKIKTGSTVSFQGVDLKLGLTKSVEVKGKQVQVGEVQLPNGGTEVVKVNSNGSAEPLSQEEVLSIAKQTGGGAFNILNPKADIEGMNAARESITTDNPVDFDYKATIADLQAKKAQTTTARNQDPTQSPDAQLNLGNDKDREAANNLVDKSQLNVDNYTAGTNPANKDTGETALRNAEVYTKALQVKDGNKYRDIETVDEFNQRMTDNELKLTNENLTTADKAKIQVEQQYLKNIKTVLSNKKYAGKGGFKEQLNAAVADVHEGLNRKIQTMSNRVVKDYLGSDEASSEITNKAFKNVRSLVDSKTLEPAKHVEYNGNIKELNTEESILNSAKSVAEDLNRKNKNGEIDNSGLNRYDSTFASVVDSVERAGSTLSKEDKQLIIGAAIKSANKLMAYRPTDGKEVNQKAIDNATTEFNEEMEQLKLFVSRGANNGKSLSDSVINLAKAEANANSLKDTPSYAYQQIAGYGENNRNASNLVSYVESNTEDGLGYTATTKTDFYKSAPQLQKDRAELARLNKAGLEEGARFIKTAALSRDALLVDIKDQMSPEDRAAYNSGSLNKKAELEKKYKSELDAINKSRDDIKYGRPQHLEASILANLQRADDGYISKEDFAKQIQMLNEIRSRQHLPLIPKDKNKWTYASVKAILHPKEGKQNG